MIDRYVYDIYWDGKGGCDRCLLGDKGRQEPMR